MILLLTAFCRRRLFSGLLLVLILSFGYGCGNDGDTQVVDFSKTISVPQPRGKAHKNGTLRVAVGAMVSPKETFTYYRQILDYIGTHLDKNVELIQRKTYDEINELFGKGLIDLAFVCSGPYAIGRQKYGFQLLATPQVQGSHFYHAYLIVNKESPFHLLEELMGRTFAFTDPDSNTGKLVPTHWLAQMKERPETFFGKTIYTYSHDNSILAVARALVDGASVDGLIWEYYNHKSPGFTSRTRIIKKSEPYGMPPLVASGSLATELKERIRELVFSMHQTPEGRAILKELMIDRFIAPQEAWYDPIRRMEQKLALLDENHHAIAKP